MNTRLHCTAISCLILAGIASVAHAATISVPATVNAELSQNNPDSNFPNDPHMSGTLVSGEQGPSSGFNVDRDLYEFDLSAIPTNAVISAVSVTLIVTKVPFQSMDSTFDLLRVLKNWNATQVTWNSVSSGVMWEQGGAGGPTDARSTPSGTVGVSGLGAYTFGSSTGLVADVQAWVSAPGSNHGWLLMSEDEFSPETARHFGALNYFDANSQPALTITYSVPAPPVPPTISGVHEASGNFLFSFNAESNRTYTVQFRASAGSGTWFTLTNVPAQSSAGVIAISDPITSSNRFYRVQTP